MRPHIGSRRRISDGSARRERAARQQEPITMRFFFLLILLAGVALGVAYPWTVNNFSGRELGSCWVFDPGSGFKPVDVPLKAADAPVRILVDLTSIGSPR